MLRCDLTGQDLTCGRLDCGSLDGDCIKSFKILNAGLVSNNIEYNSIMIKLLSV